MTKRRLTVAFWNVSNLFEIRANTNRAPQSGPELSAKLGQVIKTLRQLGNGDKPPALIGLAEVATDSLIKRLARALHPSDPRRTAWVWLPPTNPKADTGLALLYDTKVIASVTLLGSSPAPGLNRPWVLWAECQVARSHPPLYVAVNHWKSRLLGSGKAQRRQAGQWLEGTVAGLPHDANVIALGDFNDEPFDPSVRVALLARRSHAGVLEARAKARLFNTAWRWLGESDTYASKGANFLRPRWAQTTYGKSGSNPLVFDQMMVSRALLKGTVFALDEGSVRIHVSAGISQTARHGRVVPTPWAWQTQSRHGQGASDHFPIAAEITY